MVHAATAVMTPANPRKAFLDWRARSSGVGILAVGNLDLVGARFCDIPTWYGRSFWGVYY